MAETVRTSAELLADYIDNTVGAITPERLRNFVVSCVGFCLAENALATDQVGRLFTDHDGEVGGTSRTELWYRNNATEEFRLTSGTKLGHYTTSADFSQINLKDAATYITKDVDGNLSFTDAVAGTKLLDDLGGTTDISGLVPYTGASGAVDLGSQTLTTTGTTSVGKLEVDNTSTYIDKDGSGNMTFTDAVAGTITLQELSCPPKVEVAATSVAEGNNSITGFNNKVLIKWIKIATTSTNWTLTFYTKDDYSTKSFVVCANRAGNYNVYVDYPYEDEDATNEFHYNFTTASGSETHDISVFGYKLR